MTRDERQLLNRLLEIPFQGRKELTEQAAHALVREIAGPGDHAGSIELKTQTDVRAPVRWSVPVEGRAVDVDGVQIDFLLHVRDGVLDALEVVKADGSSIGRMPKAKSLQTVLLTYNQA